MARAIIGGLAVLAIVALAATAYVVATSSLHSRITEDVEASVAKAQELLLQNASLEGLRLQQRVEAAAREPGYLDVFREQNATQRTRRANDVFHSYRGKLPEGVQRPDWLALVDKEGHLVAMLDAVPPPDAWLDGERWIYPSVQLAVTNRQITAEFWNYEDKELMKVGVAPVIDLATDDVLGALVIAYALTAAEAQRQNDLLRMEVAFFFGDGVHATSFHRVGGEEDVDKRKELAAPLFSGGLAAEALGSGLADSVTRIELGGEQYVATAGRLPRFSTRAFPDDYPEPQAGAAVMMSLDDALAPLSKVRLAILLLGLGAVAIALIAMFITAKRILGPLDRIEVGINDIINGNIDRTFQPMGSDLDGLANALNVMLARLLGRPEPGEEEYDENGNVVTGGGEMAFDESTAEPASEDHVALAQEPEADYYQRIYNEYIAARRSVGHDVDGISYDSFVAKLRLNEAKLKKQHQSRAVRFRVVVNGEKVSLKPVPIV